MTEQSPRGAYQSSRDALPPPRDDKEFNDPTAWGFCDYCIFMVAVVDGVLIDHRRYRNSADTEPCNGSGKDPVEPVPETAEPRQRVTLRKGTSRASTKAYWQRQRFKARASARAAASDQVITLKGKPKVTVTSLATGEEVDITGVIMGPLELRPESSDVPHNND